jgi:hypothetical protein
LAELASVAMKEAIFLIFYLLTTLAKLIGISKHGAHLPIYI